MAAATENLLHPPPAMAEGRDRAFGWALRPRGLVLLLAGSLCLLPGFFLHLRPGMLLLALALWNAVVLLLAAAELRGLPRSLTVTRSFLATPALDAPTAIELLMLHTAARAVTIQLTDSLHTSLAPMPLSSQIRAFPREATPAMLLATPVARGDFALGPVYCRVRGALGLAERWITAHPVQTVRVYPSAVRAGSEGDLPLLNARQLELEKRRLRHKGTGRDFQSLREYQPGDALRDLSWTASARRGKLITRQFTTERSQQVWVLLDAGRLSQTTAEGAVSISLSPDRGVMHIAAASQSAMATKTIATSQLDQAASAALLLARAVQGAGDKFGLLAYGRTVRQQLVPGNGAGHLRLLVDLLAQVASERGEANHLRAVARFQSLQRRRSLVVWITEVAESAGRPEIALAVAELARRHLPLILLLEHPELTALAGAAPADADQMFAIAAAREMEERRRILVADLERGGALVVRTTSAGLAADAIRNYLEIKAKGLL